MIANHPTENKMDKTHIDASKKRKQKNKKTDQTNKTKNENQLNRKWAHLSVTERERMDGVGEGGELSVRHETQSKRESATEKNDIICI